jgi:hypothetical protein
LQGDFFLTAGIHAVFRGLKKNLTPQTGKLRSYPTKFKKGKDMNNNNNDIKVVTFDCDGVLFDTKDVNRMYYNKVLEYMGMPPLTPEQTDYAHIQTAHAVLRTFFKDEDSFNKADAFRTSMDYTPFVGHMKIEPFLKTLLKKRLR